MTEVAKLRSLPDVVAEYEQKLKAIPVAVSAFQAAGSALKTSATIGGEYGWETIDTSGRGTDARTLEINLRRSAWIHVWNGLNLPAIASARDKKAWEQALASPPPFTLDNLRATFGPYLENPRATILRGLAEVFADLDPAYKSHEKMKIGVRGLPKRVIITYLNGYGGGWGWDKIRDIINALAAYQGKPLVSGADMAAMREDGDALRDDKDILDPYESHHAHRRLAEAGEPPKTIRTVGRGVWLKRFQNGNGHLFFGPEALHDNCNDHREGSMSMIDKPTAYTKGAKRRRKKAQITLAGGKAAPQRTGQGSRNDIDQGPPPILKARAKRCPVDAASVLNESDMGRCILELSKGETRAALSGTWDMISAAYRNYCIRCLGKTGSPQGAAIAMVPEPMETDPSLRVDLRTPEQRDAAARRAWEDWETRIKALPAPQMKLAIRGALDGFLGDAVLWRDQQPTAIGVAAVAALKLLTNPL